jgi:hypothetical protein
MRTLVFDWDSVLLMHGASVEHALATLHAVCMFVGKFRKDSLTFILRLRVFSVFVSFVQILGSPYTRGEEDTRRQSTESYFLHIAQCHTSPPSQR